VLQRLRIGFLQPFVPFGFLELGKGKGGVVIGQALFVWIVLVRGVIVNSRPQEMIIDKPTSPKLPRKPFSLYGIGIDAEFVRLHHFHTYNYIMFFCKIQGLFA